MGLETEFDGDCLSRGINFMGIICPGGRKVGDQKSGDHIGLEPNASQPILEQFGRCMKKEMLLKKGFHPILHNTQ